MLDTIYQVALGSRSGPLNRAFTFVSIFIVVVQVFRLLRFHFNLNRWRYRLHQLEQDARREGVVSITDPSALPPLDAYTRLWDMVPSMAIMFGLLGTFIGLTVSLSKIPVSGNVDEIQKGLSVVIPMMGTAFWTSLAGLVIAITVRITNSTMASMFRRRVVNKLMISEPMVIESLETTAFQQGRDGALLRPHGIRELLWHQNRLLNQTVARVAPQVSEGVSRGITEISQKVPIQAAFLQQIQSIAQSIDEGQRKQQHYLHRLVEQQAELIQALTGNPNAGSTTAAPHAQTVIQPGVQPDADKWNPNS